MKIENMEIWKDIKGYEGLYQVSNLGRVKSLKFGKEKILRLIIDKKKYIHVNFWKNKKSKTFLVHRLVAMAFLPNPQNLPVVNHKDENPSNNNVDNLEFCDQKYNCNYGTRNDRISKKINQFSLDGNFIRSWSSMTQIKRELRIDQASISKCCTGKLKSAGKFVWKYHI